MAEQIAQDPAFAQMTAALQASVAGNEPVAPDAEEKSAGVPAGGPGLPTMDAEKYAEAMSNVLQNQHFMEMAEKLGQQIMSVRDICIQSHQFRQQSRRRHFQAPKLVWSKQAVQERTKASIARLLQGT